MSIANQEGLDAFTQLKPVDDSRGLSGSHYSSFIADLMRTIHSSIPPNNGPPDFAKPAHVETREDRYQGRITRRAVVFLLTNGCEWALRSASGCTMCGHIAKQARTDRPISADQFISQFTAAFSTIDFRDIPVLNMFNNGSFFNDEEIPSVARRAILRMIDDNRSIKKLLVECRPEFITDSAIEEAKTLLTNTDLEVAIGLETADDRRRLLTINKGFTLKEFIRAAAIITRNSVRLRSYILLKPPFAPERDAVEDAISSIKTAFSLGVDIVSLEAMTVQKYTLVDYLYERGLYRVPWLWSIVDVVRNTAYLGEIVVGMFKFYPSPDLVPSNCSSCNERVMDAIISYNRFQDIDVFRDLDCECRAQWAEALEDRRGWREVLESFVERAQPDEVRTHEKVVD